MFKNKMKRGISLLLTLCMVLAMVPMNAVAVGHSHGDTVITPDKEEPAPVEGFVWVLTDSVECKKIVHTHKESCFYKSCDHKDGHLSSCYSSATEYALCEHDDETQHSGSVTLTDVVEINGTNVAWKTEHPAYPAIYAVYKAAYDEAYASTKLSWLKETAAKAAGVAALVGKTFCYTTEASATPDLCTHGECTDWTGSCYSKLCLLEEHTHVESCFQYTWTLKTDLNKNGVADDADEYFTVKYVADGEVVYEKAVLVGMPTPEVEAPEKQADAQYTYVFAGWDLPIADTVTEDAVYTAVYTNVLNKYTVTWVDEDGTKLEEDKDVEYGQMPLYDGELPTKKGDNTVSYTFAGWTPAVDKVTGNVTYTATYTSKSVFAVNYYINNQLQKTEYVVDGEKAPVYEPTKEHYMLTPWMSEDVAYDFEAPVTAATELHAEWKLVECIVTVKAPNAAYSYNGTGVYNVGSDVVIEIVPKEGYAVSKILVNGTSMGVTYDDGVATVKFTPDATTEKYLVEAKTEKVKLGLQSAEMDLFGDLSSESIFNAVYVDAESYPSLSASDVKVEYLAYSITLFNNTYEWWTTPGADVSLQKFLDQYGLGSLASYIPTESQPHAFGAQSTERVRVSYAGNEKYCAVSAETTVALIDMRIATEILLNKGVKVTYGATAEDILKLVFKSVNADKTIVTEDYKNVTIQMDSLNAGTRKATVSYKGDNDYAASVAEIEVTIAKAAGKLDIESYNGKYGPEVNASQLFSSNANHVQIAMGLFMGDNASADAGTVIYVNLPTLIDLSAIENETIRALAEKVVNGVNEKLSGTMTVKELKEALESALPYVEAIENAGYEININATTISMLVNVLNEMGNLEGVGDISLNVTLNKDIILKDAGAYLLAGVTADSNYTTVVNGNYVVITPDGYRAELGWNIEDENGIITLEALRSEYDLGASVTSVLEGNKEDANKHVYTVFFGVNKAGEMVLTQDQKALDIGAYAQVAFIADAGNTMYYAEPIVRSFLVAADVVKVQFVDQNGKVNNDRIFEYGEDATMNATAFNRHNGEVEADGVMTYMYFGMQANGEFYRGTTAPTRPGAYTVVALFIGNDEANVGAGVGALVIKPINPDFAAEDTTVQYDGNEHKINVKDSFGMNRTYIIADENGNINVVVPNEMHSGSINVGITTPEFLEKLKEIELPELPTLPEELTEYYQNLETVIKKAVEDLKKEYKSVTVTLNAPFPSELGVYKHVVIGFKDIEHKVVVSKATLTIMCEHVYDNACDNECNICGTTREVELHKETYIDRFDSSCVKQGYEKIRCKACHEVVSEKTLPLSEEHAFYNGKCLLCGASEHCEHDYVVVKELAPTCVEAGYVWTECSKCGAEKNYEVGEPTGQHGETYIDRFDSSCVKHGYEKTRCKVCHEVLSEIELPLSEEHAFYKGVCLLCGAHEHCQHEYETVRELAPTCGEAGYIWTKCTKCGDEYNHEVGEPTGKHTFDNDCDATCNGCFFTREVGDHVYDNACDADCNECGAQRTPAKHVYDHACDTSCNVCGAVRTTEHTYDNACDAECNVCGNKRTPADHVYQNKCDADCDVCGATRTPAEHIYDNACDATCNECQATRQVADHVYKNACDADCDVCGAERTPADHVYDNACDSKCNVCEAEREVPKHAYVSKETVAPTCGADGEMTYTCSECGDSYTEAIDATGEHTYANLCDTDCDVCGATREVGEHVYNNACDATCNECGAERTPAEHVYDDEYDATCNICGFERQVPEKPAPKCEHEFDNDCDTTCNKCGDVRTAADHVYDNACDARCNVCDAQREVPAHVYANDCDAECDVCGFAREAAAHVYDHDCDASCNTCGAEREVAEHVYDDEYDADCNVCGATRDVMERPTEPSNPDDGDTPPKTGDNSRPWLWIILLIASAAGMFAIIFGRKRYSGKYSE